jgi:two-component system, OmpR family, KDP operon response regulator KdpE
MALVLLVEDDHAVRRAMTEALRDAGHVVQPVGTASDALGAVAKNEVDLIVLDLGLPDIDGNMALRYLRGATEVPVIIATARTDDATIVQLLNEGADDYITKPFSSGVLTARVGAVLRRAKAAAPADDEPIRVCELVIDKARREATLCGNPLKLTRREFDLLAHLAERCGKVVSKSELAHQVWHQDSLNIDQTIDVHLSWLRRKLGETAAEPRYLHTVRGVGIKLIDPCVTSSSA